MNRILAAALAAALALAAPVVALAAPISGYPAASTPLSGSETMIGTQSGSTVQITAASVAAIVTAATNTWTGVQTFPAPGASKGSIVLTPGGASGTPPNGSLWVTSTGLDYQAGGLTLTAAPLSAANSWSAKQAFAASGAGGAGVNLGQGAAPTSPANGDVWITSAGMFFQAAGATQTLITGSNNSWPAKQSFTASTSGIAGTNFGVGVAPSSPANGDFWITNSGVFAEVNGSVAALGVTVPTAAAGGSNTQVQYNCSNVLCGATGFGYATSGHTLTGPDGTTWANGGITLASGGDLNLNGGFLVSNSTPLIFAPPCSGATWLIGPSTSFCSHDATGGTDDIGIGTIVFDSLTTGFGNTTAGSENMHLLTTGSDNSSFGFESLHVVTTGSSNSALGFQALSGVTTGGFNIGIGQGAGADIDVGSFNLCIFNCGTLETGNANVLINGASTLTSGNSNLFVGPAQHNSGGGSAAGQGIVTGHSNVWIGGQGTPLSDQSGSITMADGEGTILFQYLSANSNLSIKQPVRSTGNYIGMAATTVSGITAADASPVAGDRGFVTDATTCTFNSSVTGGGSTKCPVVYSGSAWVAG